MKKVITYGTFDLFHQGHYNILKRAKEYGDYLIVGVTSESYDIERGKLSVKDSLTKRIENVMKTGFVDEVIIEEYLGQKIRDIIKYDIDVLVIGDDWKGKFDHLKQYCEIVYLERTKNISSTQIREQSSNIYKIGMIVDKENDNDIVSEVKFVSGLHVQNILVKDIKLGERFCEKYSINKYYMDFDKFAEEIDIVIVSTDLEDRYGYIKQALEAGKHVISAAPVTLQKEKLEELFVIAKKNRVALIENITTVYLRAFTQLLWMVQGDIVGKILNVKCVLSSENFRIKKAVTDMSMLSATMLVKLLGIQFDNIIKRCTFNDNNEIKYAHILFLKGNTVGSIELGTNIELENELVIVGENATVTVKDDWWNTGYFEVKKYGEKFVKKYSYNFEGNGFRYILQELLIMLRDNRSECTRLFTEESLAVVDIVNEVNNV